MVIALTRHCLQPSSSNSPSCLSTQDRMSSKPGSRQQSVKKTHHPVSGRDDTAAASRTSTTPAAARPHGAPAKGLPVLNPPESPRALDGKRARRRMVLARRASEGSCSGGSSRLSTVVELPGISTVSRRHSVAGPFSTADEANLEVFVSPPLKRCSSYGGAEAGVISSRTRERPLLLRRSGPGATPLPPSSPRSIHAGGKVDVDTGTWSLRNASCSSSRHFELTLQKIEETRPPHRESGCPSGPARGTARRKNAVASLDRQYLGGVDYHEFRSGLEGRRYANISEFKTECAEELLSHNEEGIGLQEKTEDEQLRQKCLKWLETLPQK